MWLWGLHVPSPSVWGGIVSVLKYNFFVVKYIIYLFSFNHLLSMFLCSSAFPLTWTLRITSHTSMQNMTSHTRYYQNIKHQDQIIKSHLSQITSIGVIQILMHFFAWYMILFFKNFPHRLFLKLVTGTDRMSDSQSLLPLSYHAMYV